MIDEKARAPGRPDRGGAEIGAAGRESAERRTTLCVASNDKTKGDADVVGDDDATGPAGRPLQAQQCIIGSRAPQLTDRWRPARNRNGDAFLFVAYRKFPPSVVVTNATSAREKRRRIRPKVH